MSLDDSSLNQPLVNRHIVVAGLGRQRSNSWGSPADFERFNKTASVEAAAFMGYNPDLSPLYFRPTKSLTQISAEYTARGEKDELEGVDVQYSPPATPLFNFKKLDLTQYMRNGSIRGSIFNLCSATLGAGALSIPSAFADSGVIFGTFLLLVGGWATIFSIELLVDSRKYTGLISLEEISVVCFGKKFGFFVEFNILILCFGTLVAYIVAVGDLVTPLILLSPLKDYPYETLRDLSMTGFWLLIMAPLSSLEKINSLRFTSFLGVVAIFFLAIVTFITSLQDEELNGFADSWGKAQLIVLNPNGSLDWGGYIQAIPIIMFAFTCQINVIPIYNELERASARRFGKVTFRSVAISFSVYIIMGIFGYLNFRGNTNANILTNYCVNKTKDPLHISAYIAILATIALAFPLSVFPLRYTMDVVLFRKHQDSEWATVRKQVIAFLVGVVALLTALRAPSIKFVYSLIGGTTSVFCNFILPVALTLKLGRNKPGLHTCLVWSLGVISLLCGIVSTFGTFYYQFFVPQATTTGLPGVC